MAYKLMKTLINRATQTKEQLTKKANVYYAAGQLSDDEYTEIIEILNEENEISGDVNA
jgi:hypothetical protein